MGKTCSILGKQYCKWSVFIMIQIWYTNTTAEGVCRGGYRPFLGAFGPAAPTHLPLEINLSGRLQIWAQKVAKNILNLERPSLDRHKHTIQAASRMANTCCGTVGFKPTSSAHTRSSPNHFTHKTLVSIRNIRPPHFIFIRFQMRIGILNELK
jgi:hypothetical protein